ncbi:MAG: amino acid ABC transporter permease [Methylotenera sp.]|jgi:general L-amino acid transport system permease protein|nr:amino acid ABC transporter permease [Methylotenera sp.]
MKNLAMTPAKPLQPPPHAMSRGRAWLKALFGTPLNALLSLLIGGTLLLLIPPLLRWAVINAVWIDPDPASCRAATGACWNFVWAKLGQLLFGIYPHEQRWRPGLVCALIVALLGWSVRPSSWRPRLALFWLLALTAIFWLMGGGLGLPPVPSALWGGLPVTLILTVVAIGLGFPIGVLLALGRRSPLPALRMASVVFIEAVRGLPLLSILFVASIMLPLFLPESLLPDKFTRALVALTLFASAYFAEVVRGGLQAIPKGQFEAAASLSLPFWKAQRLVILPQAIRIVIPALANTVIVMIKNTSLVLVVGLFDIISSGKAALADPAWPSPAAETYLFIGAIFFVISFGFARFADFLEQRGKTSP